MRITYNDWTTIFETAPTIYLNGMVLEGVIEADEEAGHVIVYDTDEKGNYLTDGHGGVRTRKITGRVSVEGTKRTASDEPEVNVYGDFMGYKPGELPPGGFTMTWVTTGGGGAGGGGGAAVPIHLLVGDRETVKVTPAGTSQDDFRSSIDRYPSHDIEIISTTVAKNKDPVPRLDTSDPAVRQLFINLDAKPAFGCRLVEGPFIYADEMHTVHLITTRFTIPKAEQDRCAHVYSEILKKLK